MNEEKIIDYLKEIIQEIEYRHKDGELILVNDTTTDKLYYSIKGLLDLYNKEIQRNKDLEQIEKEHKEENGRLREKNINLKEKIIRQQEQLNIANKKILAQKGQLKVVNNSYIPKSKVKEKIEEYNKMIDATFEEKTCFADNRRNTCMEIIQILQELLEESEKKYGYRRKYI